MEGWKTIKSFKHKRLHLAGENVDPKEINPVFYDQLEKQGLIRYVDRPDVIMPKKVKNNLPKKKRNVRKSIK